MFAQGHMIFSPEALLRAWTQIQHYAKTEDSALDPYEAFLFEQQLVSNAVLLSAQAADSYVLRPFIAINVPKAGGDRMKVWTIAEDAVVAQAVINAVGASLEAQMSPMSYGNRLHPNPTNANVIFRPWMEAYEDYQGAIRGLLKGPRSYYYRTTDISNFYPSIKTSKLLAALKTVLRDSGCLPILSQMVNYSWTLPDENAHVVRGNGLPQGPAYSGVLANYYLSKLDSWLKGAIKGFARYVDDMFLLFDSAESSELAWNEFRSKLEDLGLKLSSEKTTTAQPVTNELPARDLLDRIRYDDRSKNLFDRVANLSSKDKQAITAQLKDQFFDTGEDGIPLAKAAQRLNYLFKTQRRLLVGDDTQIHQTLNDISLVLRSGPLKTSTTRGLLRQVLEYHRGELPPDLRHVIREAHPFVRLIFLETVRGLTSTHESVRAFVRELCSDHFDAQLRAHAFFTLFRCGIPCDLTWLLSHCSKANDFVLSRALLCLLNANAPIPPLVQTLAKYAKRSSPEVISSVLYVLGQLRVSQQDVELVLDCVNAEGINRPSVASQFLYICLRYKQVARIRALSSLRPEYGSLSEPTKAALVQMKNEILSGSTIISPTIFWSLYAARNELFEAVGSDLTEDLDYCIKATSSTSGDNTPAEITDILRTVASGTVDTPFPYLTVHPRLKLLQDKDRKYSVANEGTADEQIVEVVTRQKLEDSGKTAAWVISAYNSLPGSVRCRHQHVLSSSGSLRVHYYVPPGYRLLAELSPLDEHVALRVLRTLAKLGVEGHVLPPLDPFHILVNDSGDVKLIGYSSCAGVQRFTSTSGKSEVLQGNAVGAYCLGLLLFFMVGSQCPYSALKDLEQITFREARGRWARLSDSHHFVHRPHSRWIINKATRREWHDRYATYDIILGDIEYALEFLSGKLPKTSGLTGISDQQWSEISAKAIHLKHFLFSRSLASRGFLAIATELYEEVQEFLTSPKTALAGPFLAITKTEEFQKDDPLELMFQFSKRLSAFVTNADLTRTSWSACPRAIAYLASRLDLSRTLRALLALAKDSFTAAPLTRVGEALPVAPMGDKVLVRPKFKGRWLSFFTLDSESVQDLGSQLRSEVPAIDLLAGDVSELCVLTAILTCEEVQLDYDSHSVTLKGYSLVKNENVPLDLVLQSLHRIAEAEATSFGQNGDFPSVSWFAGISDSLLDLKVVRRRYHRLRRPMGTRDREGCIVFGPFGFQQLQFGSDQLVQDLHDIYIEHPRGTRVSTDIITVENQPVLSSVLFDPFDLSLVTTHVINTRKWFELPWVRLVAYCTVATLVYVWIVNQVPLDKKELILLVPGGFLVNTVHAAFWELAFYRKA